MIHLTRGSIRKGELEPFARDLGICDLRRGGNLMPSTRTFTKYEHAGRIERWAILSWVSRGSLVKSAGVATSRLYQSGPTSVGA